MESSYVCPNCDERHYAYVSKKENKKEQNLENFIMKVDY